MCTFYLLFQIPENFDYMQYVPHVRYHTHHPLPTTPHTTVKLLQGIQT
jgi:hypothetical protein